MKAVIRDFFGNPKNPRVVAEVLLDDTNGSAVIVTNKEALRDQLMLGIIGKGGERKYPEQGEEFIRCLPAHFTSAYRRAEIVG